jgi:glycosyltransferase involved in cell wall biosynthesis
MKILEVLTYYRPWVSGLTIYVERLGKALVNQGHDVTVLTSQYDPLLPRFDVLDGVKVVRIPVALRISKGVIMPGFGPMAWKLARRADLIHLHLPQFDAPGVALRGRIMGKPVVLTYHCDLQLPRGSLNRLIDRFVLVQNRLAAQLADVIVTYTRDYGTNSPFLSPYMDQKLQIVPPPVTLAACSDGERNRFGSQHQLAGRPVIGISARLASEKGVEVLLNALPIILEKIPNVLVLHAGPYEDIIGEEAYARRLAPIFKQYKENYKLLGTLHGADLSAFYRSLDVLCICSLNSTESFGLVQIEAMRNGVPVAACNLPGVRQPVTMTGMGEITPVGDHRALAQALIKILHNKEHYLRDSKLIAESFDPSSTATAYLSLFQDIRQGTLNPVSIEPDAYVRLGIMRDQVER